MTLYAQDAIEDQVLVPGFEAQDSDPSYDMCAPLQWIQTHLSGMMRPVDPSSRPLKAS